MSVGVSWSAGRPVATSPTSSAPVTAAVIAAIC